MISVYDTRYIPWLMVSSMLLFLCEHSCFCEEINVALDYCLRALIECKVGNIEPLVTFVSVLFSA